MTVAAILLAIVSSGVALVALWTARGVGHRLRLMNQSHWELRYEHSKLKARIDRLAPEAPGDDAPPPASPDGSQTTFVPLKSVRSRPDAGS